jgi:hypothetical protein
MIYLILIPILIINIYFFIISFQLLKMFNNVSKGGIFNEKDFFNDNTDNFNIFSIF